MFKVKFDMTEGRYRRVANRTAAVMRPHSSSPNARRRYGTATTGGAPAYKRRHAVGSMTNVTAPAQAGADMSQRYSPVFERAEDPTIAEDFMPADPQTQHKIFRNLIMFDPIAGPATEYYRDLAFSSNVILSGIEDGEIIQFYQDAIEASGIIPIMPVLLSDYLTFGKFVFHMIMDTKMGYWTETIPHDLDYVSIKVSPIPSLDPIIDIQPTQDMREWAISSDERIVAQRRGIDPILVSLMAAGRPIPLAPENTMFLPRRVFSTDYYGTSYLTRIMPFKIYEKALLDASIAGARRRAGPLWHIKVWPDATDVEMSEVLDLFFAAEEDPIGGKVVTREGVEVVPVGGGGADFWKLSDEWAFLSEAKMHALGVSTTFLSGEANYNSMDMVLSAFLEKIRAVRAYFTRKIMLEKMFLQLAQMHGFVKRSEADLAHRIRTSRKISKRSNPEYQLPTIEWDKPLSPIADRDYLDILKSLEEAGLPMPIRMIAQVAGFDIDKALDSFDSDLETRKKLLEHRRAIAQLSQQYGFDEEGAFKGGELGGLGGELGGELGGGLPGELPLGEEGELPTGEEVGLAGLGGGEEAGAAGGEAGGGGAAELPPAAPTPGAGEGFGADLAKARFPLKPTIPTRKVIAQRLKVANNIVKDLEAIPVWDADGALFGLTQRRVAKILDRIDHTNPEHKHRQKLATNLPQELRRKEGLDSMQATMVQYLAIRLGFIPPVQIPEESFDRLRKFIVSRMDGNGLTKSVSNEIVMLSKIAEAGGRRGNSKLAKFVDPVGIIPRYEGHLSDNRVLTGVIDSNPFLKS
jgi:hypothetical protein